nr:MbeD/MobD like protein [uncultured bacterium]
MTIIFKTTSLFVLVALMVCAGLRSGSTAAPSAPVGSEIPSAAVATFLAKQGFDAKFSTPAVTSWERQTFNLLQKEQWQAKSRAQVPNWKSAYYRYTIVKETYQSQEAAKERGNHILEKPPGLAPEEDKSFPLRAGFSFNKNVYIVSCNVSMFHEHLKKFTRELERTVILSGSPRKSNLN